MRIRSIKPEFWRSDDVSQLAIEDRLLYIGLWSYVDDNGAGRDALALITADLFASDLERDPRETFARVSRGLSNLSEAGRITRYSVDGRPLLVIVNWDRHQRVDKPNKARYPLPTSGYGESREILATPSGDPHETLAPGTEEQGNRGTGEQGAAGSVSDLDATPDRADVDALCEHLADLIEINGSKRPTITKAWRDAARLMVDRDEIPADHIRGAITWSQGDEFWRSNILSMPKLREKYPQLRLQAMRSQRPTSNPRQQHRNQIFENAMAWATEQEANAS